MVNLHVVAAADSFALAICRAALCSTIEPGDAQLVIG
jgi:hypothetical protein